MPLASRACSGPERGWPSLAACLLLWLLTLLAWPAWAGHGAIHQNRAWLLEQFHWILYVFGVFLIYSGIKIYFEDGDEKIDPSVLNFHKGFPLLSEKQVITPFWLPTNTLSLATAGVEMILASEENSQAFFTWLYLSFIE